MEQQTLLHCLGHSYSFSTYPLSPLPHLSPPSHADITHQAHHQAWGLVTARVSSGSHQGWEW